MDVRVVTWTEPNRAKTPPLHIAARGARYSSLTGVWWLDDRWFVVNHRSGLRVALFDRAHLSAPVAVAAIPHLTDAVTAARVGDGQWDVAVSGCWACQYSIFRLTLDPPTFTLRQTKAHAVKSFAHGVCYDGDGQLWVSFNTGQTPRVECGAFSWPFEAPWGPRDVAVDRAGVVYAVATAGNPQRTPYPETAASVWRLAGLQWERIAHVPMAHTDAGDIYGSRIYLNDQQGDVVVVVDIASGAVVERLASGYSFPHGLRISPSGCLAVTNYGTSQVVLTALEAA